MENLNDLIWTDEDSNEDGEVSAPAVEMHTICMIAFCGNGYSGAPCGHVSTYRTAACAS